MFFSFPKRPTQKMSQNPQKPRASSPQTPPGSEKSGCLSFEGAHEAAISNKPTQNGGTFKQTHPRSNREKERRKKASVWAIWMQGCFRAACSPNLTLAKSGSAEFGFLMDRKTKSFGPITKAVVQIGFSAPCPLGIPHKVLMHM